MTWKARWYSTVLLFSFYIFESCNGVGTTRNSTTGGATQQESVSLQSHTDLKFQNIVGESGLNSRSIGVGDMVSYVAGNFLYTGKLDTAYVVKVKQGKGTSAEDGIADGYELRFTGSKIKHNIGCCEARIINEGDLNGDGCDDLTLYQYPENGCTIFVNTLRCNGSKCTKLIDPFMYSAACEPVPDSAVQALIIQRGGKIFFASQVDTSINGVDTFVLQMEPAVLLH